MACAIHGQNALCDNTCAGFINGTSEPAQWDPATAAPPFPSYEHLLEAWRAQNAEDVAPPSEEMARSQGWLADNGDADKAPDTYYGDATKR